MRKLALGLLGWVSLTSAGSAHARPVGTAITAKDVWEAWEPARNHHYISHKVTRGPWSERINEGGRTTRARMVMVDLTFRDSADNLCVMRELRLAQVAGTTRWRRHAVTPGSQLVPCRGRQHRPSGRR